MALSGLGEVPTFISVVGSDHFSGFLRQELGKRSPISLFKSEKHNGVSVIFVSRTGERAIFSNKKALMELNCAGVSEQILPKLEPGDIVFFGGYFHLLGMRRGFGRLLSEIAKRKGRVFFDACYDEYGKWKMPFIKKIDTFFLNEVELRKISGKNETRKAVKSLLARGVKKIILKKGKNGATQYSRNSEIRSPAINVRAVNTTGAGDFFNAGYTYGELKGYGIKTKLACGNFVAGMKISKEKYYVPNKIELEKYLKTINHITTEKVADYNAVSEGIARRIMCQLKKKPDSVLALASGTTPMGAYDILANAYARGKADFSKATFMQFDEYIGAGKANSEAFFLQKNFLQKVNFRKKNIFLIKTNPRNPKKEIVRLEKFIGKKGIDLLLLGIGENCHIAFNEPGTKFSSKTRIAELKKQTIHVNSEKTGAKTPKKAITIGLDTIMSAKKIILAASGEKKAVAVKKAVQEKPSINAPASVLQGHRNVLFIIDSKAAKLLRKSLH
jgi:glucosamine-6-phosphate deaminase